MRSKRLVTHVLLVTIPSSVTASGVATAQSREWYGEAFVGTAWNLPTPLIMDRFGEPKVRQRVTYRTHGFDTPLYYAVRVGRGSFANSGSHGVELELVHHKLYIDNPLPPVEHFEISHGYNLAYANVARPLDRFVLRLGAGLVIAHPEGRIGGSRRTVLRGGYHIAGGSFQISVARRYPFRRSATAWFTPEAKITGSWARVPLGDDEGTVAAPNVALHVLAGIGARTGGR